MLKNEPVDYKLKFHTGKLIDDFYITLEALDTAKPAENHSNPFDFFKCHFDKVGSGIGEFSTARNKGERNKRVRVPVSKTETVVRQFDKLIITEDSLNNAQYIRNTIFPILEDMKDFFGRFYACSSSQFDFAKVRELCEVTESGKSLKRDASNFVAVYQYQCSVNKDFRDKYLECAKMLMHDLTEIKVEEAFGKMGMSLVRGENVFRLADVSDGTIEALIILLILSLADQQHPTLIAIDEPEVNLHPAWQKILAKWIQTNGNFTQYFISTHSPDFLDAFTKGFADDRVNIYVAEMEEKSTFKIIEKERLLDEIIEGWQLGDFYRVNDPAIGGWPW